MRLRITLVVTLIANIGMLGLTCFVLRPQIENLRRERAELIKQRDQHLAATREARNRLQEANARITDLETKIQTAHKQLEATAAETGVLQRINRQTLHELENIRAQLLAKSRRIAEWDVLGLTPGQVLTLKTTNQSLQRAITNLTQQNEKLSRDYADLRRKNDATEGEAPELPPIAGRILALDPKWKFVVLNIGESEGLKPNGVLLIARDSELLGKVKITRVDADRSIADLLPGSDIAAIREGDHVFN